MNDESVTPLSVDELDGVSGGLDYPNKAVHVCNSCRESVAEYRIQLRGRCPFCHAKPFVEDTGDGWLIIWQDGKETSRVRAPAPAPAPDPGPGPVPAPVPFSAP